MILPGIGLCLVVAWLGMLPPSEPRPERSEASRHRHAGHGRVPDPKLAYREALACNEAGKAAALRARAIARWISDDPHDALEFACGIKDPGERQALLRDLIQEWSERDGQAAIAWADQLDNPVERKNVRSALCLHTAERDPRLALELALAYPGDEKEDDVLLKNLVMRWTEREPQAAVEWIRSQPEGEWKMRLVARSSFILAKSDPLAAAHQVAREMESGPVQDEAVLSVLHQWVRKDKEAAARWAEAFPEGELRERALNEIRNFQTTPRHAYGATFE